MSDSSAVRIHRKRGASMLMTWAYDVDGVRSDLTGATIDMKFVDDQGATALVMICTLQDQTTARGCWNSDISGVLALPDGIYYGYIKYTWPSGKIEIIPDNEFDSIELIVNGGF